MNTQTQETKKISIEEIMAAAEEMKNVREEVRDAISTLNPVEIVTPTGIAKTKKDWIAQAKKGNFENPEFSYDEENLKKAVKSVEELKDLQVKVLYQKRDTPAKEFVWDLLYGALNDAIATINLAESILRQDDVLSKVIVSLKYAKTEEENLKLAHEYADTIKRRGTIDGTCGERIIMPEEDVKLLDEAELRAPEIKRMFEWLMNEYGGDNKWPVEIIDDCSAIDVRDKSSFGHPIIAIPADRKVNGWKLAELLGHEIECHWRNSVNAEKIGALKGDDEVVYEGLAVSKDNRFNRLYLGEDKWPIPYYILAQELALSGNSFSEVAEAIYEMLPESISNRATKSWIYTYRTFRGVTDTKNPHAYAFTKDRAYFEGIIYANELRMRGLNHYLSFGTLKKEQLERLIALTELKDIERIVLPDKKLQQKAIEKMLNCLRYGNVKQHEALVEVKPRTTTLVISDVPIQASAYA